MILEFYTERNKSKTYSKKPYTKFNKELSLLLKQPEIGIKTELEAIRGLIVDEFILNILYDNQRKTFNHFRRIL